MTRIATALGLFVASCKAGTTLWSGSFNAYPTASSFDNWSWANQVGAYQWYIHGSQNTSHYLAVDPSFKNPATTNETRGLRVTIDTTSTWNSQFERTELIPQTTANLGAGNLLYHFSISHPSTNLPDSTLEHQVCFFESHFTELKYGVNNGTHLTWMVGGVGHWDTLFTPGVWFNFAYDIDFTASTVGLWASTGSNPLVKVVQNIAASTSTNSADWHLGVLRLVNGGTPEDWYFSGVYIEQAPITTSVGTGGGGASSSSSASASSSRSSSASSTVKSSSSSIASSSSTSSAPQATQTKYGQCGVRMFPFEYEKRLMRR
ncbi:Carbohydrate-binding module family 1 protein [Mycena indigotica]|uniref:Carbohydrate-binding module family 1 protein n=1 Tax=Mycena indigotica TaxID=2126181 RepID=A0A8H6SIJ0_9AGAR|nr:Carbohydrate-binding module family 1 protein [Mycena indigotica]KAF7298977.1 Carbohydrate-binding module family 1 protein [Mycena indigotica]